MKKLVIIGGDAAGMSTAAKAKRTLPEMEVTVLEQSEDVSYSACGMPYNIADPEREMNDLADRIGVSGWVKNRRDGRVEALVEGEKQRVEALIQWCRKGPPAARVHDVEVAWEPYRDEFTSFEVAY